MRKNPPVLLAGLVLVGLLSCGEPAADPVTAPIGEKIAEAMDKVGKDGVIKSMIHHGEKPSVIAQTLRQTLVL